MWEPQVVERLRPLAAGIFREARIVGHERNVVSVQLSEGVPIEQARRRQNEVEAILSDLLDQTVRLEVVPPAAGGSAEPPSGTGVPDTQAPPPPAPVPDDAQPVASAESSASGSNAPEPVADSSSAETSTAAPASGASSEEAKVQRILDRFPGSTVVRVDEGTT